VNILLLNAGSSSLKASLVDAETSEIVASGSADWAGAQTQYRFQSAGWGKVAEQADWRGHSFSVRRFLRDLSSVDPTLRSGRALAAVGHRIVHGGAFTSSVKVTRELRERIEALADLAPLHNPPSLETLAAAEAELPGIPHVAVFDTAFHATLPRAAKTYPVPEHWTEAWGIRRYGFHGLSHAYCAERAAELLDQPIDELRLVICHLGHGCSASAVQSGCCVETTMGFTPLEGLMMATRSGSIDPGIILHLQQRRGLSAEQVDRILNRESGLLGVSGTSADMRQVLTAARDGDSRAQLALEMYTRRVRQAIGAMTVTLGGADALVFTAGVGEHSPDVRESICAGLDCFGFEIDPAANADCEADQDIAAPSSPGRILVIATREDVTMLKEVQRMLLEGTA
jgi:acetate kinase